MPDRPLDGKIAEALGALDHAIRSHGAVQRLGQAELDTRYPNQGLIGGWRMSVQFSDGARSIDILAPTGFPWAPIRIALSEAPPLLRWPHVEENGFLCLPPQLSMESANLSPQVVAAALGDASELIEKFVDGSYVADFRAEFNTYWTYRTRADRRNVVSLCSPSSRTGVAFAWEDKGRIVIADGREELANWVTNSGTALKPNDKNILEVALLKSPFVPLPRQFPKDGETFNALIAALGAGAAQVTEKILSAQQRTSLFLLGVETVNGPTFAGFSLDPRPLGKYRVQNGLAAVLSAGFREAVPASILLPRIIGASKVNRQETDRVDAVWIHGRGRDPNFERLRLAKVIIIGCGSLGADVALLLAKAGVPRFVLIDPKDLRWQNISRHALGAPFVGQNKATALSTKLRADFPHLKDVIVRKVRVERLLLNEPSIFAGADLVVAVTSDYGADAAISDWQSYSSDAPPVLYGWTEEHACAGHALLIRAGQGCFKCGFDGRQNPIFRVTRWPTGDQRHQEPGCGAVFQPYGATEMSNTISLVAGAALDALLDVEVAQNHKIWAAPRSFLERAGGTWSDAWLREFPSAAKGGSIQSRDWLTGISCACATKAAAE